MNDGVRALPVIGNGTGRLGIGRAASCPVVARSGRESPALNIQRSPISAMRLRNADPPACCRSCRAQPRAAAEHCRPRLRPAHNSGGTRNAGTSPSTRPTAAKRQSRTNGRWFVKQRNAVLRYFRQPYFEIMAHGVYVWKPSIWRRSTDPSPKCSNASSNVHRNSVEKAA